MTSFFLEVAEIDSPQPAQARFERDCGTQTDLPSRLSGNARRANSEVQGWVWRREAVSADPAVAAGGSACCAMGAVASGSR
jgi:hypothetical protein